MGLLYILPNSLDEAPFAWEEQNEVGQKTLRITSYGLPPLFWFYLACILLVIIAMSALMVQPLEKLWATGDTLNRLLSATVWSTLLSIPLTLFGFFFYSEELIQSKKELILKRKCFHMAFSKRKITLRAAAPFSIGHYLDSPNMAKLRGGEEMRGFQNKGYFELFAFSVKGQKFLVDRSSSKADLQKLQTLLESYLT